MEQCQGAQWPTDPNTGHPAYCTHGNDVHLMGSAKEPPPYLRLHWAESNGAAARPEFTIGFRPEGVDPIEPIAPGAGEVRSTDCVMMGFKRVTHSDDWQVQAIGLRFQLPTGGAALRSLIRSLSSEFDVSYELIRPSRSSYLNPQVK